MATTTKYINSFTYGNTEYKLVDNSSGYTKNTGTVTKVSTTDGLTGGDITTTGTLKANLRSFTKLTNDSAAATETSGRIYPVVLDKSGYLAVNVPWTNVNSSYAASSHTHGNITNAGALGTASRIVVTDANKKITVGSIDPANLVVTSDSRLSDSRTPKSHTHGNITNGGLLGTASRIVITDANKKITVGTIDPANLVVTTDSRLSDARTPTSHTHGNITNDGKIGSTADYAVVTTTGGAVTAVDLSVTSPTASSTTTSFIDTVSQSSNGKISATKKTVTSASTSAAGIVQLSSSTSSTSETAAATPKAVKTAYDLAAAAIPKSIGTAAGDIIYWSAASTPARLGKGSNGQVLKLSNGLPAWGTDNDTKNTAGSTDTSSKIYLVGATSQGANPQTYSDNQVYATNGQLDANKVRVAEAVTLEYNSTTKSLDFIFA